MLRFWKIAGQFHLKYIMIGGVATNLYGYQRTTEDTDIPFLHINHLIYAKKATNRPKDRLDVIELEKIRIIIDGEQGQG